MSTGKAYEIVLLGGNFGGVGASHFLLRHIVPALRRSTDALTFRVTLITPNTEFFFKPASPRASVQPDRLAETRLWQSLSTAFKQYSADQFRLIQGLAVGIDVPQRTVSVKGTGSETDGQLTIAYDSLVISTGTTSSSALWTLHEDQQLTSAAFQHLQAELPTAKTVLIAGGGPVGVEMAGEVAFAYPNAKVTLLSGGSRLLRHFKPDTSAKAQVYLEKQLGVTVIHNLRVEKTFDSQVNAGTATVPLSDGTARTADIYINATGGIPNSGFLPRDWLDETGRIIVKDGYFRIRGSENDDPNARGIYAVGDIVAGSKNTIFELDAMVPTVCSSIGVDIIAQHALTIPVARTGILSSIFSLLPGKKFGSGDLLTQKEFKPIKDTVLVPIGPSGGVGQLFGWQAPSWFVKMAKGKTFLIEMVEPIVSGTKWKA